MYLPSPKRAAPATLTSEGGTETQRKEPKRREDSAYLLEMDEIPNVVGRRLKGVEVVLVTCEGEIPLFWLSKLREGVCLGVLNRPDHLTLLEPNASRQSHVTIYEGRDKHRIWLDSVEVWSQIARLAEAVPRRLGMVPYAEDDLMAVVQTRRIEGELVGFLPKGKKMRVEIRLDRLSELESGLRVRQVSREEALRTKPSISIRDGEIWAHYWPDRPGVPPMMWLPERARELFEGPEFEGLIEALRLKILFERAREWTPRKVA